MDFDIADNYTPLSNCSMGPGEIINLYAKRQRQFPENIRASLIAGTLAIYCVGRISYIDIFNERHETRFVLHAHNPDPAMGAQLLMRYDQGNYAT